MSYPILAPNSTWYKSSVARNTITEINIVDSYTVTGSEEETWNADADNLGSIKCYRTGTVITIAGNGSGKIAANADSSNVFSDPNKAYFSNLTAINNIHLFDTSNVTTMRLMFNYCESLTNADLSSWDVRNVTDMVAMFQNCYALISLDVSNWDASNVLTINHMFNKCNSLTTINSSGWKLSSVTHIQSMFQRCNELITVDVSNWDTDNVLNMNVMFGDCNKLTTIDTSNWNTSACTTMNQMFWHCNALTSLDVSNWDVSKVTTMLGMFENCNSLKALDVSRWNTVSCTDMNNVFYGCSAITNLDLSNWNTSKVTTLAYIFDGMTKLEQISFGTNFNLRGGAITNTSYNAVLPTPNSSNIPGADGNWYDLDGGVYAPSEIPSNKAATYYASKDVCDVSYLINHMTLLDLAKAIRTLKGTTDKLTPGEMVTALMSE